MEMLSTVEVSSCAVHCDVQYYTSIQRASYIGGIHNVELNLVDESMWEHHLCILLA